MNRHCWLVLILILLFAVPTKAENSNKQECREKWKSEGGVVRLVKYDCNVHDPDAALKKYLDTDEICYAEYSRPSPKNSRSAFEFVEFCAEADKLKLVGYRKVKTLGVKEPVIHKRGRQRTLEELEDIKSRSHFVWYGRKLSEATGNKPTYSTIATITYPVDLIPILSEVEVLIPTPISEEDLEVEGFWKGFASDRIRSERSFLHHSRLSTGLIVPSLLSEQLMSGPVKIRNRRVEDAMKRRDQERAKPKPLTRREKVYSIARATPQYDWPPLYRECIRQVRTYVSGETPQQCRAKIKPGDMGIVNPVDRLRCMRSRVEEKEFPFFFSWHNDSCARHWPLEE